MPMTATLGIIAAATMARRAADERLLSRDVLRRAAAKRTHRADAVAAAAGGPSPRASRASPTALASLHDVFFNGEPVDLPRAPRAALFSCACRSCCWRAVRRVGLAPEATGPDRYIAIGRAVGAATRAAARPPLAQRNGWLEPAAGDERARHCRPGWPVCCRCTASSACTASRMHRWLGPAGRMLFGAALTAKTSRRNHAA